MSLLYLNADIWDHIFSSLTRRDVVALARTDRRINALATDKLYHTITLCNEPRCNMCPKYETLLHPYVKRALRSLELFVGLPFDDRHEEVLCNLLAGASLTRFALADSTGSQRFKAPRAIIEAVAKIDTLRDVDLQGSSCASNIHAFSGSDGHCSMIRTDLFGHFKGLTTVWLRNLSGVDAAALQTLVESNPLVSLKIHNIFMRDRLPLFASHVPRPPSTLRKANFAVVAPVNMAGIKQFTSLATGLDSLCIDSAFHENALPVLRALPSSIRGLRFYCWSLPFEQWTMLACSLQSLFPQLRKLTLHEESIKSMSSGMSSVCDLDAMIGGIVESKLALTKLRWDVGRLQPPHIRALVAGMPTLRRLKLTIDISTGLTIDDVLLALASKTLYSVDLFFLLPRVFSNVRSVSTWGCVKQTKPAPIVALFKASSELRELVFHGLGTEPLNHFTGINSRDCDQRVFTFTCTGAKKFLGSEWVKRTSGLSVTSKHP